MPGQRTIAGNRKRLGRAMLEFEGAQQFARCGIPHLQRAITTNTRKFAAAAGKLHRSRAAGVCFKRAQQQRFRLSFKGLLDVAAQARQAGERIVFTNGCFDILHAGHVAYLEEARELGDRLVVAVNDDASVARLKGPGRPVNSLERRAKVLAGLQAVDYVVDFVEDTPEALLRLLRPEVLVKGGDYARDQVVGADIVLGYGGDVQVLGLVEDLSTSALVQQIAQGNRAAE